MNLSLYVVVDSSVHGGRDLDYIAREAIDGGADIIQLRCKNMHRMQFLERAQTIRSICREKDIPFVVNDCVITALESNADGVHVGQSDARSIYARSVLGSYAIIGVSAQTVAAAIKAEDDGADYIGAGPVYPTSSKDDASSPIAEAGLAEICAAVKIPVVGIGGIHAGNAASVRTAGAAGIAVISAVSLADDMREASRMLKESFLR